MLETFFKNWPVDGWVIGSLAVTAWIYFRGWLLLRRAGALRWQRRHLACFLGGLASIFLALSSPIDPLSSLLLQVHMVQHLLLMVVAPPLIWLGLPLVPLLRGLPVAIRRYWAGPLLQWQPLRRALRWLTQPVPAWLGFVLATWLWHLPPCYQAALQNDFLHYLEHVCFLVTGLLFWWPVYEPYPGRLTWSRWLLIPYLILADIQNTALSAWLTFSERVIYPHYEAVPWPWSISPLEDQAAAGVIMWVPGSLAYLIPLAWIGARLLFGDEEATKTDNGRTKPYERIPLPILNRPARPAATVDILKVPLLGRFLHWRYARLTLQIPLLLLAGLVIWDGLTGPELAPINLAGVLPWTHWRGFVVLGLLAAGNVFCLACPFMLPRNLARRWRPAGRTWPGWLRSKWLAIGLLVLFFWAYEAFSLWNSPWLTAWIALAYFAAALVIDGLFRGAAFCKYVCPIGQFHFFQSLTSPLEVRVRNHEVCRRCSSKDCIRGNETQRGCELQLYLPRKSSNMDCTVCLDCIHACPHDNIGILSTPPGKELWHDPQRSGIGRFSKRIDVVVLVLLLVFAAFANAAGMVAPVVAWQDGLSTLLDQSSPLLAITLFYGVGLFIFPVMMVGSAAALSRWWSGSSQSTRQNVAQFACTLLPLGAAMWLTHFSFHLFTSAGTAIPALQRFAADWGIVWLGEPVWSYCCAVPPAAWLLRLEIVFLDLGLLLSLYTGYRIARHHHGASAFKTFVPWLVLILLLFAAGVWIVFQPMQMRGTM